MMATVTTDAKKKKLDCFHKLFGTSGCSGTCTYKYNSQTGQYVLQSGSKCEGSDCAACASTLPFAVRELVKHAGKRVFPDPDNVTHSCGVTSERLMERLLTHYVDHVKLQRRYRFLIALNIILSILVAAGILAYFLSR
jgi:hypothetical protein